MPIRGRSRQAVYFAYLVLALLFAIAATNRFRDAIDRFDELFHGVERARTPFDLLDADLSASYLQPEARDADSKTRCNFKYRKPCDPRLYRLLLAASKGPAGRPAEYRYSVVRLAAGYFD